MPVLLARLAIQSDRKTGWRREVKALVAGGGMACTMAATRGRTEGWTSPLGVEGSLRNPGIPGGRNDGEANPTELHAGVQGAGGQAAARGWPGAVGGGDGTRH